MKWLLIRIRSLYYEWKTCVTPSPECCYCYIVIQLCIYFYQVLETTKPQILQAGHVANSQMDSGESYLLSIYSSLCLSVLAYFL